MSDHPIAPSLELVQQWRDLPEYTDGQRKMIMITLSREKLLDIATQAARWGADQELEACVEWLAQNCGRWELSSALRAARRPKPPSLKERALQAWAAVEAGTDDQTAMVVIRRALEQLDD